MLPAIEAGLAAMGAAVAGVGSAFATYFLPVVAIIAGVVLAVYLLKRAWETNFGGIRDTILGAWEKVKLVFNGIRELISSLSGGSGRMSAELAQKLEQAGLMGLVVTVFRIYYRVRQFLTGLWQAFSSAFGKIRAILEPAVRALMQAYGALYKAVFSILEIFGLAAASADASSYRSLGETLGSVLGVIAKVGAYLLKFVIYNLVAVIKVVAWVVRAVVWLGKTIVTAFIEAGKFIYKFFLPIRLLVQALRMVGRVVYTVWQVLTGDLSVVDGLKSIGSAVFDFLATPFRWARDVIVGVWNFIKGLFSSIGRFFNAIASSLVSAFMDLPLVRTLADVFGAVRSFLSGDSTFFEAGKQILIALGEGIWSAVTYPFDMLKKALGRLRKLLPFSDAEEGPLSSLTRSGMALLEALSGGIAKAAQAPARALQQAFGFMNEMVGQVAVPSLLAGTLALTPVMAGELPAVAGPIGGPELAVIETTVGIHPAPEQARLLGETRGALAPGAAAAPSASTGENLQTVFESMFGKLDALANRPIEVSITTLLDGRQVAQSVYRDIRERKIKNYETL